MTLSDILTQFHDLFGNIEWKDEDNVRAILDRLAPEMAKNVTVTDAMANSDEENVRLALDVAVNSYLTSQINLTSGRMDDMVKLLQLYGDKDNSFSSLLLDSILYRLRRQSRKESYPETEESVLMVAEEDFTHSY